MNSEQTPAAIAVIGMAGRFPDAADLDGFWRNLASGIESLITFSEEEMVAAGVPAALLGDPKYVGKGTVLEGAEFFDANFFGINPREAEIIDPQQRVFLECAWEALENSGYGCGNSGRSAGVYASASMNTYLLSNVLSNRAVLEAVGPYQLMLGAEKDYLATRVAYKLNLTGPAVNVQTACSSSLVAVQMACRSLLDRECDLALAGGVSLAYPARSGYLYAEGMILSPDGHCRPFDAQARGTRPGMGAGAVVLKRLEEAVEARDTIRAVILGAAINNDGSGKMGYTAPSVEGQARVLEMAQRMGGVEPESISYIEAHGTATILGDPIEVAALERVFRARTARKQFCAIGSLKSNLGHLDAAAGVAGLIKTVLALEHEMIPPSLHFREPNPQIDFAAGPFFVNDRLRPWKADGSPRRAGVSSFGIGGTNAHVVLEEAPARRPSAILRSGQLLVLSAKTEGALGEAGRELGRWLQAHPEISLADAAYTLQVGRARFPYRRHLACGSREEALAALLNDAPAVTPQESESRRVGFLFSGQGSQYAGMGEELYRSEAGFRRHFDECARLLEPHLGRDLRSVLFGVEARNLEAAPLDETWLAQPALFAIEYSLARMWMEWGIVPDACLGHSIGEYVAACLAGTFSLEDGLTLVAGRGRLMQALPRGSMLAVSLPAEDVGRFLDAEVSLAAVNSDRLCTVAGPDPAIRRLESELTARGVPCRRVHTSHAFHSPMMDPAVKSFEALARRCKLSPPSLPFVSNLTGTWIKPQEAADPLYWALHLRHTVRFADGLRRLLEDPDRILLEVGPGQTLTTFAQDIARSVRPVEVCSSLPRRRDAQPGMNSTLDALGRMWAAGAAVDWEAFHRGEELWRVPLPGYRFERKRYCIEPAPAAARQPQAEPLLKKKDVADWFYVPSWKRSVTPARIMPQPNAPSSGPWLVFDDGLGLGDHVLKVLAERGESCVAVRAGSRFERTGRNAYSIQPAEREHYDLLLRAVSESGIRPRSVLHLWNVTNPAAPAADGDFRSTAFYSLLYLAQAWGNQRGGEPMTLIAAANRLQQVCSAQEPLDIGKALLIGPCTVIPQEYPVADCRCVDVGGAAEWDEELASNLLLEPAMSRGYRQVAYRGRERWERTFEQVHLVSGQAEPPLRPQGVYLITGGLGGIGMTLAQHLAATLQARLALISRSPLPAREGWDEWLAERGEEDATSLKIRQVRMLEQAGAEVMLFAADVSDRERMRDVLHQVRRRFGRIHGVVHAAGIAGGGIIQLKTAGLAEPVLAPKVEGTLVLDSLLAEDRPDFFLLCSSIDALCGSAGAVDYCSANAFLDAFALSRSGRNGSAVVSVNWNPWQQVGMVVNANTPRDRAELRRHNLESGIAPSEGVAAFREALARRLPQLAVVTRDLNAIARLSLTSEALPVRPAGQPQAVPDTARHERPNVKSAYAVPESEVQRKIADIWKELLGIGEIGIDDDFFELGGHSLLATGVLSRMQAAFGVALSLRTIFEHPTIRALAEQIDTTLWARGAAPVASAEAIEREEIEL